MVTEHAFLLQPGMWVGEGKVSFSASSEQLDFATQWTVESEPRGEIFGYQEVIMEGATDPLLNSFQIFDVTPREFKIMLENPVVGQVNGSGLIDGNTIAWEFREEIAFQGYEVYEMETEGLYKFHAEYAHPDQFRTIIDGYIRRIEKE